jgi:hypothetical protein
MKKIYEATPVPAASDGHSAPGKVTLGAMPPKLAGWVHPAPPTGAENTIDLGAPGEKYFHILQVFLPVRGGRRQAPFMGGAPVWEFSAPSNHPFRIESDAASVK